mmetsp:Transcript_63746/g.179441  ORF Transcript_63746/g.179441 Transcript_63746/m.179441 type:complete len:446 (+) Transcript_63746:67-1404(+)
MMRRKGGCPVGPGGPGASWMWAGKGGAKNGGYPGGPYGGPSGPGCGGGGGSIVPYGGQGAYMSGTLADWNPMKACGWVDCDNGKRLFVHKSEFAERFPDDGAGPPVGTRLLFVAGTDAKSGKERAQDIHIQAAGPGGAGHGPPAHGPGYGNGPGYGMGMGCQASMGSSWGKGGWGHGAPRLRGVLSEWKPEKACGWVESPSHPGHKFFAHKSEFAMPFSDGDEPPPGTPVSFILGTDMKSGKERAQDIQFGAPAYSPAASFAAPGSLSGTITEWNSTKACGWIVSPQIPGRNIFAHKSEFVEPFADGAEPPSGTEVSFVLGTDQKSGKERACAIRIGGDGGDHSSRQILGILSAWTPEKACGWIEVQDHPGKRYFAHKSEFAERFEDGEDPVVGTAINFVVGIDQKSGRERAQEITVAGADQKRRMPILDGQAGGSARKVPKWQA